ncbi:MAG: fibronectin type III domain-containing protein [Treponema sp.]|nr:fibronectin type III domain-containing protein [Treponema sp.]
MRKVIAPILIVYIFLFVSGSIFAVGERTISLGGEATWRIAESRTGITEARAIRPYPVLLLSSTPVLSVPVYSNLDENTLDLSVSFDERDPGLFRDSAGHYRLTVPPDIEAVDRAFARAGTGAALFGRSGLDVNSGPIVIQPQSRNALFAPGNRIRDFTIEFWLYPLNLENGEQIISWGSAKPVNGSHVVQRIQCTASKNRLQWSFVNFFASIQGNTHINIEFSGSTPIVPKTWSHHLIRFDASTGLLEYMVDGNSESIVYATRSGRESSEVYTPVVGNGGGFLLGERFSGLMDEFKIHNVYAGRSSISRFTSSGGRIETRFVDLGENSSGVIRINASGGRTNIKGMTVRNEFRENGRFRFLDDSEMNFFVRASENPYLLNNSRWVAFTPGTEIDGVRGRYVQIAVDFYPSADGETSPYLDELQIVFMPGEPPLPPRNLTASAADSGVMLRWRHSPTANTAGYLVYYSAVRGELFGSESKQGSSPIDVGITNNIYIDGLKNGTLYYFRIAAYDLITGEINYNIGEFSAEVTARPLAGLNQ